MITRGLESTASRSSTPHPVLSKQTGHAWPFPYVERVLLSLLEMIRMRQGASPPPPNGYVPWDRPSPVLDGLGGFFRHDSDPWLIGFYVDEHKVRPVDRNRARPLSPCLNV